MSLKYLMDENLDPIYQTQLRCKEPDLIVWAIGDPNTPPKETLDPEVLLWCRKPIIPRRSLANRHLPTNK